MDVAQIVAHLGVSAPEVPEGKVVEHSYATHCLCKPPIGRLDWAAQVEADGAYRCTNLGCLKPIALVRTNDDLERLGEL
eukprot:383495-Prymnesium_polylepis.1